MADFGSASGAGLERYVRSVQDFPKKGVLFRDVTGILDSGEGFRLAMIEMERALADVQVDKVAAPESRGFIFGAALADRLRCAFVPIRISELRSENRSTASASGRSSASCVEGYIFFYAKVAADCKL